MQQIAYGDLVSCSQSLSVQGGWEQGQADDLVYVIYSSGTTGKAKGIPINQKNLTRLFSSTDLLFDFKSDDVWSVSHSLAFDFSVWEIWGALVHGAKALMLPTPVLLSHDKFHSFILQHGVTILNQTPSYFKILAVEDDKKGAHLKSLRYVIFGAEKLRLSDLKQWAVKYGLDSPQLINMYGLTEATVHATFYQVSSKDLESSASLIGSPLPDMQGYLANETGQVVPPGVRGEIWLSGPGLTSGYLNRPEINSKKFILSPFDNSKETIVYRTGDMARGNREGVWEYLGREDDQIKLKGYRIELHLVEDTLKQAPGVKDAVIVFDKSIPGGRLLAFYRSKERDATSEKEVEYMKHRLPRYMVPADTVWIDVIPLTPQGKVDRKKLLREYTQQTIHSSASEQQAGELSGHIHNLWQRVLQHKKKIPFDLPFFSAGGDSITLLELHGGLEKISNKTITLGELFKYPTINEQTGYISGLKKIEATNLVRNVAPSTEDDFIAVIGMAGRFPGADNIDAFWENLCEGKESITTFSHEELLAEGVPEQLLASRDYVRAKGVLDDADKFDAEFFNLPESEATILDPQQRLFMETCWTALEDAGYVSEEQAGRVGVFAGASSIYSYCQTYLMKDEALRKQFGDYAIHLSNALDFLSTRVSFKLNLTGPSMTVQTGCSTALVAVCHAMRSLLSGECDMALAGGVSLFMPLHSGYLAQRGMILSPDGHCRAFDADAQGTVPGSGVGVIVLKRLSDAVKDGDPIDAVIRGYAINNDGGHKLGMTTPSEQAQTSLLSSALKASNCHPNDVDYVETHGTGTVQGDRIELSALMSTFSQPDRDRPCYLGTLKPNIGHLDAAAGVAAIIKTVLCLKNKTFVPSLYCNKPNAQIDFSESPLKITTKKTQWEKSSATRKAGVSAMAVGGTNAHVVLEEYSDVCNDSISEYEAAVTLSLSAKTKTAVQMQCRQLANYLEKNATSINHVAYTLRLGRQRFSCRASVTGRDRPSIIDALKKISKNESLITTIDGSSFGGADDFPPLSQGARLHRVHLPTYPFERKRCWVKRKAEALALERSLPEQWCYQRAWRYEPIKHQADFSEILATQTVVVFCDDLNVSERLAADFSGSRAGQCYQVCFSDQFVCDGNRFKINPRDVGHYLSLFDAIKKEKNTELQFVYIPRSTCKRNEGNAHLVALKDYFSEFISLVQAAGRYFDRSFKVNITVLTSGLWHVVPSDVVSPMRHFILGPALTLGQEYPNMHCTVIDAELADDSNRKENEFLKADVLRPSATLVAYRRGQRLVSYFQRIGLGTPPSVHSLCQQGGVYLITGGLGEIGLTFAEHFANCAAEHVVLLQRSHFPARSEWHHIESLSEKQRSALLRIQRIEATGSKVNCVQCDVTNEEALSVALQQLQDEIGKINGVVHAAGVASSQLLSDLDVAQSSESMDVKVKGALALHRVFLDASPEFMIFCSALSTVLGYPTQTAYNSANAFLDAFSNWRSLHFGRTLSINWDTWKSGGMAVNAMHNLPVSIAKQITQHGVSREEGLSLIKRITALSVPQVVVSTQDPNHRKMSDWFSKKGQRKDKKNLSASYVTSVVKKDWKSYFGKDVSGQDSFFDLGGDSLSAVQMIAVLGESLSVTLYPQDIIGFPKLDDFVTCILERASQASLKKTNALICMKEGSLPITLFLIHPIGGNTLIYRELSSAVQADITIHSLQSRALDERATPSSDLVHIAAGYVDIIRHQQPVGPYYLAGLSFGGLLSYEMARQLTQAGERVAFVGMFDTPGFDKMPKNLVEDADIIAYMLQVGAQKTLDVSLFRSLSSGEQIDYFLKHAGDLAYSDSEVAREQIKHYLKVYKANMQALFDYKPVRCDDIDKVYFFSAEDEDDVNAKHPETGWKKMLGEKCSVHRVPGTHITMLFNPHVENIARIIDTALLEVVSEHV